jgi:hypothetical protein
MWPRIARICDFVAPLRSSAFYAILLGNPTLCKPRNAPMKTRFKMWYRLVGSAIEHAAKLTKPERDAQRKRDSKALDPEVDFQKLFLARDDDDEDSTSLAEVLAIMAKQWPETFDASQVMMLMNDQNGPEWRSTARVLLFK